MYPTGVDSWSICTKHLPLVEHRTLDFGDKVFVDIFEWGCYPCANWLETPIWPYPLNWTTNNNAMRAESPKLKCCSLIYAATGLQVQLQWCWEGTFLVAALSARGKGVISSTTRNCLGGYPTAQAPSCNNSRHCEYCCVLQQQQWVAHAPQLY